VDLRVGLTRVDVERLPPLRIAGRIGKLRARLSEEQLDCLVVTALANVRYLTGFTGSAAVLVVTSDQAMLATDGRYRTQAAEQLEAGSGTDVELVVGRIDAQRDALAKIVRESAGDDGRVGFEAEHIPWGQQIRWAALFSPSEPVPTNGLVEGLRVVKDDGEIARIAAAAEIADAALAEIVSMIDQARTESEVALALDVAMRRLGAEDRAFETIVASGPNSAKPHARPGDRLIESGDTVVIDFGAEVDGYKSDMTRTFFAGGNTSTRMAEVYEAVRESQAAGVEAVAPGVTGGFVDEVCREHLRSAGLGDAFEHGTGHGVGLDIHEAPSVGPGSAGILGAGAVVTVEPGAYLAGIGGVRIEDTLVVTTDGRRALTSFAKDPAWR
jgi:Xaa-Pro aminopeptidase